MAMGITVDFNANMVQFAQQVDKIQGRMDQFQAHSEITVKRVNSIMSSLGVGLSVAGIAAFVKSGIDAADSLGKLSTRTGVAVEQLAGLKLAAELSDTSLDQIGRSINKLSIEIGRNGEAFAELGITAKEPVEAFLQLTDLFNSIEDPQRRAALMARTLGKEYAQLAPLMDQGSAAIRQQIAEGQRLNPITAESAQRAAEFNDAMTRMATRSEGARNALAIGVLEPLSFIAEALDDNIKKSGLLKGLWDGLIEGWQNFALSDTGGGLSDDLDEINRKIGETKFQLLELRNERGDSGGQLKEEVEAERVLNDLIQERDRLIKGISDQRRAAADSPVKTETAEQKAAIDRLIGGGRAGEKQGDLAREAARIFEATRTPVERYGAEIDKLNELLKAGAIDQDT
ncbi:MAG: hypothetical protein IBX56_14575, partial [Methylomicrobium sp.]|nr:hypothetical protein [Methylomicrobium sp.]